MKRRSKSCANIRESVEGFDEQEMSLKHHSMSDLLGIVDQHICSHEDITGQLLSSSASASSTDSIKCVTSELRSLFLQKILQLSSPEDVCKLLDDEDPRNAEEISNIIYENLVLNLGMNPKELEETVERSDKRQIRMLGRKPSCFGRHDNYFDHPFYIERVFYEERINDSPSAISAMICSEDDMCCRERYLFFIDNYLRFTNEHINPIMKNSFCDKNFQRDNISFRRRASVPSEESNNDGSPLQYGTLFNLKQGHYSGCECVLLEECQMMDNDILGKFVELSNKLFSDEYCYVVEQKFKCFMLKVLCQFPSLIDSALLSGNANTTVLSISLNNYEFSDICDRHFMTILKESYLFSTFDISS